ncbi:protein kinase C and casein kinase substrate in neurons protein 1-like isoform X2 [Asterias rubens]|uniref:protein kinase C and casein kinase substrate in neurons protein 1-like isoform X2 n=1 Tax=Asterias rubens TaxID=7604 RepID=UPI0014558E14|nr:protein kinase C and casein kinase substrate in neurons protein 1-like isoform X2 [Asterias rubens]
MSEYSEESMLSSEGSFWEIGQFRRTVKRVDDGHRLCNDLMLLLQERSEIERKYSKSLKHWSKRWNELIDKGPEYGTIKSAWKSTLTEADRKSEIHQEIAKNLMQDVHGAVKTWQKENYHKKMMNGFKETTEAMEGFTKAQKPWGKAMKAVNAKKAAYHTACKAEKQAVSQETTANRDTSLSPDQVKKMKEKVERCQSEKEKMEERYNKSLEELKALNPRYMEDMGIQFDKTQVFEKTRIKFFKNSLKDMHKVLDLSISPSFGQVYTDFIATIENADAEKDLKWWKSNHGTGMTMHWPDFEEYKEELHAIGSKRATMKNSVSGGGDSITVKTVRSLNDDYNNSDYNDPTLNAFSDRSYDTPSPSLNSNAFKWPHYSDTTEPESLFTSNFPGYTQYDDNDGQTSQESQENGGGVEVRALYKYEGLEDDELSFDAGDILLKLEEEDEQGWCRGRYKGREGLYPSNYAENL